MKSFADSPPMACVVSSTAMWRYPVRCRSGWCCSSSATAPTFCRNASALTKSLNLYFRRISLPSSESFHSGTAGRCSAICSFVNGGVPPSHAVHFLAVNSAADTLMGVSRSKASSHILRCAARCGGPFPECHNDPHTARTRATARLRDPRERPEDQHHRPENRSDERGGHRAAAGRRERDERRQPARRPPRRSANHRRRQATRVCVTETEG